MKSIYYMSRNPFWTVSGRWIQCHILLHRPEIQKLSRNPFWTVNSIIVQVLGTVQKLNAISQRNQKIVCSFSDTEMEESPCC